MLWLRPYEIFDFLPFILPKLTIEVFAKPDFCWRKASWKLSYEKLALKCHSCWPELTYAIGHSLQWLSPLTFGFYLFIKTEPPLNSEITLLTSILICLSPFLTFYQILFLHRVPKPAYSAFSRLFPIIVSHMVNFLKIWLSRLCHLIFMATLVFVAIYCQKKIAGNSIKRQNPRWTSLLNKSHITISRWFHVYMVLELVHLIKNVIL